LRRIASAPDDRVPTAGDNEPSLPTGRRLGIAGVSGIGRRILSHYAKNLKE
jgi:hypothetical protein